MLNCEGIISKDECVSAIRTFKNGKSPGTDGLPAELYKETYKSFSLQQELP
jgi:hypothetical protein